jgi:CheY-like chemotaxis protein
VATILRQTASACRRAALLATQLLTFSKGGAPVRRIGFLSETLRDAVGLASAGSSVAIELSIAGDLRPSEFDAGQIGQVLHNVLLNARQSMAQGGVVSVRAENAPAPSASLLPTGDYIRITVGDQGCGIPQEALSGIFDPYFTTKEFGSGLGLAIAYAVITRHGGHIGVESRVGVGTTVSIYLPASEQQPVEALQGPEILHTGSGRILVMDDEESIRRLLRAALARLGFQAVCASNGAEAVELYEQARASGNGFTAVIVDLTVPGGMGGKEVASRLMEIDPSARIILSSGYSNDSTIAEFRKYGFCDVLLKPWTTAQLSGVLRRAG